MIRLNRCREPERPRALEHAQDVIKSDHERDTSSATAATRIASLAVSPLSSAAAPRCTGGRTRPAMRVGPAAGTMGAGLIARRPLGAELVSRPKPASWRVEAKRRALMPASTGPESPRAGDRRLSRTFISRMERRTQSTPGASEQSESRRAKEASMANRLKIAARDHLPERLGPRMNRHAAVLLTPIEVAGTASNDQESDLRDDRARAAPWRRANRPSRAHSRRRSARLAPPEVHAIAGKVDKR